MGDESESYYADEYPEDESLGNALRLIGHGLNIYSLHSNVTTARQLFEQSLEVFPTSEGYTYLAWMISLEPEPDLRKAIEFCKTAITLDPTFGNPYNDIGSYLKSLGEHEKSVEWFERAMKAPRSTNRLAPFINLARHFSEKHQHAKALAQLYAGEQEDPHDEYVKVHISQLEKLVNSEVAHILKERAYSFSGEESPAR